MKKIHGITQKKFMQVLIPIDRACCEDDQFLTQVFTSSTSTLNLFGSGTEEDPLYGEVVGGGSSVVNHVDTATISIGGTGSVDDPLYAEYIGGDGITTLYTGDGTISDSLRTVTVNNGSELYIVANPTISANRADFQIRGGGGNSGVRLMANGQASGFSAGQYGFKIYNGGDINSDVNISGGGTFTVVDQGSIQLTKVQAGGSTTTILMNPSNIQGLFMQDNLGVVNAQIRLDASGTGSSYFRQSNATIESNINITPGVINLNKVVGGTTTPLLKIDSTNTQVVLPQRLSAPFLTTDGSGNILAGTKATHVDPTTGTVSDVVNALIAAGLMA